MPKPRLVFVPLPPSTMKLLRAEAARRGLTVDALAALALAAKLGAPK